MEYLFTMSLDSSLVTILPSSLKEVHMLEVHINVEPVDARQIDG